MFFLSFNKTEYYFLVATWRLKTIFLSSFKAPQRSHSLAALERLHRRNKTRASFTACLNPITLMEKALKNTDEHKMGQHGAVLSASIYIHKDKLMPTSPTSRSVSIQFAIQQGKKNGLKEHGGLPASFPHLIYDENCAIIRLYFSHRNTRRFGVLSPSNTSHFYGSRQEHYPLLRQLSILADFAVN